MGRKEGGFMSNINKKIGILLILFILTSSIQFASAGNIGDDQDKKNIVKEKIASAYEEFQKEHGTQWNIDWNDKTGTPKTIFRYTNPPKGQLSGNSIDIARNFLGRYSGMFLMRSNLSDLVVTKVDEGLASYHVRLLQTYKGLKVYNAETSVHMNKDGQVEAIYNDYKPGINIDITSTISEANATDVARNHINPVGGLRGDINTELLIYPKDDGNYLAYKVLIQAYNPLGDWLVFVDAKNGNILGKENLIRRVDGTGAVFDPNPVVTSGNNSIRDNNNADSPFLTGQRINRVLRDLDNSGRLKGPYVDLNATGITGAYKTAGQANEPTTHNYQYTRSDDRFEEVTIYYAIDSFQRYIQSLGFTNVNNRSIPVHAHYQTDDNSYYSSADHGLHFGDGGVDDAEDADIILHEYGHSIQDNQVPGWGSSNESRAMGEGFGDYIAASFYATVNNGFQRTCVGDWDATSYSSTNPPCLRRVDGQNHYPENIINEEHTDGEIWSASLWDIWLLLGSGITDKLVIESHFSLSPNSNFRDGANAIILADRNLYGGVHRSQIEAVFQNRGILPFGSIAGKKFDDLNANGINDGEPGLASWSITLTNQSGVVKTTTTDSNGNYNFTNLTAGDYTVGEILKPGYIQTAPSVSETGLATYKVTLVDSDNVKNKDFGNFKLGEVYGIKYNDINGNSQKEPGDQGLSEWQINLKGTDTITGKQVSLTTITDANGNYNFTGLTAGTYVINEKLQNGWIQTAPAVSKTGSANHSIIITTSGTIITGKEFGNFKLGEVHGMKFEDLNANRIKDTFETGLADWKINIKGTDTITGEEVNITTTTDANGNYSFLNLTNGTYVVSEELKSGWIQTTPSTGTYTVNIISGSNIAGQDFGNFHKGKITGGGWIKITGDPRATFGIVGQYPDNKSVAQGNVEYQDHIANLNIKSIQINTSATTLDKKKGAITGLAQVNGKGSYPFEVYVEDNAEPGKGADVFKITLPTYPYSNGTVLSGGNIQIHS